MYVRAFRLLWWVGLFLTHSYAGLFAYLANYIKVFHEKLVFNNFLFRLYNREHTAARAERAYVDSG